MRFARTITGILLLTIGLPMLFAGGGLWYAGRQRDDGGSFSAKLERLEIPGHALVVPDLDALLRRDAPLARAADTSLRFTAWEGDEPAFLGLAPAADVSRYLAVTPHARIDRVSIARGRLPVQVAPVDGVAPAGPAGVVGLPRDQVFWVAHGLGVLDLASSDLPGRELSLVVMWPDGRAGLGLDLDLRAEVRPGWLDPATVGVVSVGSLLLLLGVAALAWQVRPREVVLVVEPSQVPVLAGRLGLPTLDDPDARSFRPGRVGSGNGQHGSGNGRGGSGSGPAGTGNGQGRSGSGQDGSGSGPDNSGDGGPGDAGSGDGGPGDAGSRNGPRDSGPVERMAGGTGQPDPSVPRSALATKSRHYEATRAAKVLVPGRVGAIRLRPAAATTHGLEPASPGEPGWATEPGPGTRPATLAEVLRREGVPNPDDDQVGRSVRAARPAWPPVTPPPVAVTWERTAIGRRIVAGVSPSGQPIRIRPSVPNTRA